MVFDLTILFTHFTFNSGYNKQFNSDTRVNSKIFSNYLHIPKYIPRLKNTKLSYKNVINCQSKFVTLIDDFS